MPSRYGVALVPAGGDPLHASVLGPLEQGVVAAFDVEARPDFIGRTLSLPYPVLEGQVMGVLDPRLPLKSGVNQGASSAGYCGRSAEDVFFLQNNHRRSGLACLNPCCDSHRSRTHNQHVGL